MRERLTSLWHLIRRQEDQRVRKLRGMLDLLRPYRLRVAVMFVFLLAGTAAGLAPPYLAGRAIDTGIKNQDFGALDVIVVLFLVSALVHWGATFAQTSLGSGWASARCRTSAFKSSRTSRSCRSASTRAT